MGPSAQDSQERASDWPHLGQTPILGLVALRWTVTAGHMESERSRSPKESREKRCWLGKNSRYLALQTEFPIQMKATVEGFLNLKQRQNPNIEKAKRKPGLKFAGVSNPKSRMEDRSKAAEN